MSALPAVPAPPELAAVLYRYAYGLDLRDWPGYRSVFADEVAVDFSSYRGRPTTVDADAWVAEARATFEGLDATQHTMTNPLAWVEGDTARLRMYVQAAHLLRDDGGDRWFTIGGYYDDALTRRGGEWRITAVTLNVLWTTGDESIMAAARRRASTNTTSRGEPDGRS
jgi:hypothetical protein